MVRIEKIPIGVRPGGVVRTATLRAAGFDTEDIRRAVRNGVIYRLRPGWLAFQWADRHVVAAVRAGGVLGCASALAYHGAWNLRDGQLHTYRSQRERQRPVATAPVGRLRIDICPSPKTRLASDVAVLRPREALTQSAFCVSPDDFLVLAESVIHRKLLTRDEVETTLSGISARIAHLVRKLDVAESGIETLVRLRLRRRGIELRPQVEIAGVGRVDFLVGNRLVIEVDGESSHSPAEQFYRDRMRDQRLVGLGYIVVRITYEQVMHLWPKAEAPILAIIARGEHRRRLPGT